LNLSASTAVKGTESYYFQARVDEYPME